MKKRILTLLLAAVMLIGLTAMPAQAQGFAAGSGAALERMDPQSVDQSKITRLANGEFVEPSQWATLTSEKRIENSDEIVSVIVELKTEPLGAEAAMLQAGAKSASRSASAQSAAASAQARQDSMIMEQEAVISALPSGAKALFNYTAVLNGFAAELPYKEIAALKADPRVKNVYTTNTYELPKTPSDTVSNEMIYASSMWASGYDGEGMLIAIVDTGVDYTHPQLSSLDAEGQVTREQMAQRVADAGELNATLGSYYKNPKVVFAYDYCMLKENFTDDIAHGTHVAGIAAANSTDEGVVIGAAYNAQIMAMKVFSPMGGAADPWILAAVDDAVKLGADAINLSLGSAAGFSVYEGTDTFEYTEVFANAQAAGAFVSCAAGNESYLGHTASPFGYLYDTHLPYAKHPDYGVVGAPSTDPSAVSVASVDNAMSYLAYFQAGDLSVPFSDTNAEPFSTTFDGKTLGYVCVPGLGDYDDYEGLDAEGKIALVSRGELSFADKAYYASLNGAVGVVIYNNTAGSLNMDLSGAPIPAVFIEQSYGQALVQAGNGTMSFSREYEKYIDIETGYEISSFSSRGITPDLKIKPEVSAPGGGIYSTNPVAQGSYANQSGTSMAAPHVAAAAVMVKQRVLKEFPELSQKEAALLTENLLLSSALPVTDSDGIAYPVQAQGAGMINLKAAVDAKAAVYNTYDRNTKVELGDLLDPDSIVVPVIIENITDEAVSYGLNASLLSDLMVRFENPEDPADYTYLNSMKSAPLGSMSGVTVEGGTYQDGVVTVPANGKCTVTVTFKADADNDAFLKSVSPYGYYAYGFVGFAASDESMELSIPFLGYVGDWLALPVMDDATVYDGDELPPVAEMPFYSDNSLFLYAIDEYGGWHGSAAGMNPWTWDFMDKSHIAFGPEGGGEYNAIAAHLTPLRNFRDVRVEVKDSEGAVVRSLGTDNRYFEKAYPEDAEQLAKQDLIDYEMQWDGRDENGAFVPEGQYTYNVYFTLDYPGAEEREQVWSLPAAIDNTAPEFEWRLEEKEGKTLLYVTARDSHYLGLIALRDRRNIIEGIALGGYSEFTTPEPFDITEYVELYGREAAFQRLNIYVTDYADNFTYEPLMEGPAWPLVTRYENTCVEMTEGFPAWLPIVVEGEGLDGLEMKIVIDEEDEYPVQVGYNRIYLEMVTGLGFHFVDLYVDGQYENSVIYYVNEMPQDLWKAQAVPSEDGRRVVLFASVMYDFPVATVNGVPAETGYYDNWMNQILVDAPYEQGAEVVLTKVKFNWLFPSYYFTYKVTCT